MKKYLSIIKKLPLGVKIIFWIYILFVVFNLILAILYFLGGVFLIPLKESYNTLNNPLLEKFSSSGEAFSYFFTLGIWYLVMAAISFTIVFWIWKGKKWARYLAIFFSLSSILLITFYYPKSILNIASFFINAWIFFYLILSSKAKKYFKI